MNKRYSKKREAIANCLRNTTSHPDAEWVFSRLKDQYPDLSLGTVYRNLNEMKESGSIVSVGVFNDKERFDARTDPHAHAVCSVCGKIIDLPAAFLPDGIVKDAGKISGFSLSYVQLCYVGKCEICQKEETNNE